MTEPVVTVAEVQAYMHDEMPFCAAMGISCEHLGPDLGVARLRHDPRWLRPGGYVNGGSLMTLADVAAYLAVFTRLGITPMAVTNELKMNFLRPAIGADVLAAGRLRKLGRRLAFVEVSLFHERAPDRWLAHATSSYALPDPST